MNHNKENISRYDYFYRATNYQDKWEISKKLTLKIEQKSYKILVFTTLDALQLKKTDDYENIHSVNPLYRMIGEVIGYIKEKNGNK